MFEKADTIISLLNAAKTVDETVATKLQGHWNRGLLTDDDLIVELALLIQERG